MRQLLGRTTVGDGGDGLTRREGWRHSHGASFGAFAVASSVALSAAATATSGEGKSAKVAAVGAAISEAAPIGWVDDPRGHVERKKANFARRSAIWAANMPRPTYGVCVAISPDSHRVSLHVADSEQRKVQEQRVFVVVFARRGWLFERFLTGRRGYQGGFSPDGEATREV